MRATALLLLLFVSGAPVPCEVTARQELPKSAVVASIDDLIVKVESARKAQAEAVAAVARAEEELRAAVKVLNERLLALGIDPLPVIPAPPVPKPPDPKPPAPKPPTPPQPVTSFRVLFVFESGGTLTLAQHSVIYAKSVSDYLTAATTAEGGRPGFRRFDKDHDAGTDTPTVKALWAAVRPQLTSVPCVAIEVNGKVTIEPLPETPAAAVALFTKYAGGK